MLRTPAIALAVALSFASSIPALAEDGVRVVARKVHFADLNIATDAGARGLAFRISIAARDLCAGDLPIERQSAYFPLCVRKSVVRAAASVGSPKVAVALGVSPEALAFDGR